MCFFFFQAEDGIRDRNVTGVQTCALPISFGLNPTNDHRFTATSPFNPYLSYGQSKMEGELLVRRAQESGDLETVVLRAPWFYGPYQPARQSRFIAAVRKGRFPIVGDGHNRRSM